MLFSRDAALCRYYLPFAISAPHLRSPATFAGVCRASALPLLPDMLPTYRCLFTTVARLLFRLLHVLRHAAHFCLLYGALLIYHMSHSPCSRAGRLSGASLY
jgi:hypothetical protein